MHTAAMCFTVKVYSEDFIGTHRRPDDFGIQCTITDCSRYQIGYRLICFVAHPILECTIEWLGEPIPLSSPGTLFNCHTTLPIYIIVRGILPCSK
jgi:hypothetical protein